MEIMHVERFLMLNLTRHYFDINKHYCRLVSMFLNYVCLNEQYLRAIPFQSLCN